MTKRITEHSHLINPPPFGKLSVLTTPFPLRYPAWHVYVVAIPSDGVARVLCNARSLGGELAAMIELLKKLQNDTAKILGSKRLGEPFQTGVRGMGDDGNPRSRGDGGYDGESERESEDEYEAWVEDRRRRRGESGRRHGRLIQQLRTGRARKFCSDASSLYWT